jgi:hypothetical protein
MTALLWPEINHVIDRLDGKAPEATVLADKLSCSGERGLTHGHGDRASRLESIVEPVTLLEVATLFGNDGGRLGQFTERHTHTLPAQMDRAIRENDGTVIQVNMVNTDLSRVFPFNFRWLPRLTISTALPFAVAGAVSTHRRARPLRWLAFRCLYAAARIEAVAQHLDRIGHRLLIAQHGRGQ